MSNEGSSWAVCRIHGCESALAPQECPSRSTGSQECRIDLLTRVYLNNLFLSNTHENKVLQVTELSGHTVRQLGQSKLYLTNEKFESFFIKVTGF